MKWKIRVEKLMMETGGEKSEPRAAGKDWISGGLSRLSISLKNLVWPVLGQGFSPM